MSSHDEITARSPSPPAREWQASTRPISRRSPAEPGPGCEDFRSRCDRGHTILPRDSLHPVSSSVHLKIFVAQVFERYLSPSTAMLSCNRHAVAALRLAENQPSVEAEVSVNTCRTRRTKGRDTSDSPSNLRLRLYEFEKIGIDLVSMRGRHPMRQALVNLKRAVLQEL